MNSYPEYLPDDSVTEALDREIRGLLTTCFTKDEDVVFRDRRYFVEPYPHRWFIRDEAGVMVAHTGVHEKHMESDGRTYRAAGLAEVCVHPACRGRGYVRVMLACIHPWLAERGFAFVVLFGDPPVYRSSGYAEAGNVFVGGSDVGWKQEDAMARSLADIPWPCGDVYLPGPKF